MTSDKELKKQPDVFENSVEGVCYNLTTWGNATTADTRDQILIAKTLLKLPKKVRQKVLDEVAFVLLNVYALTETLHFVKPTQPVIMINFGLMRKRSEEYKMCVVAHEVAHFILKNADHTDKEREADDLIEKWGFKRAYK
ncbi:MAG: hypothetical protein V1702_00850 [Candidatus Woesearchaeota archaeon]